METDRHASDGEYRHDETAPPSPADTVPADGPPTREQSGSTGAPHDSAAAHDYGYGEDPLDAAGTDGLRAADSGAAGTTGSDAAPSGPVDPGGGSDPDPATGIHPTTALRGGTAPRAVLRPVPEGFPTPPPRPARPNRRPAPKPEQPEAPSRPRGLLIAGISAAALLLLVVVVGGGILALRSLTPEAEPTAADDAGTQEPTDAAGSDSVEIDGIVVTGVSTEVGVRAVGASGNRVEPEGEFVVVVVEVENPTDSSITFTDGFTLETADERYPLDPAAAQAYQTSTVYYGVVKPGESRLFHAVFDVPIGSDPTGLRIESTDLDEGGTLPLSG